MKHSMFIIEEVKKLMGNGEQSICDLGKRNP